MSGELDAAHDALNRMRRAYGRGTGCHLSAEMIAALGVTIIGQAWDEEDPRTAVGDSRNEREGGA